MNSSDVEKSLKKLSTKKRAETNAWFFKTGKGEYGEGDQFIGVTMPDQRKVAKEFRNLSFTEIKKLLKSKIHEHRMTGLIILTEQFNETPKKVYDFYFKNLKAVNNWDLVDISAPIIVGGYLIDKKDRKILYKLSKSKDLWEQRISIVATWSLIRSGELKDTFKLSEALLNHEHDLIHKAVGWMLREAGKKDEKSLKTFLKKHYKNMPRTMLRYSIEKFPENIRQKYLKGQI